MVVTCHIVEVEVLRGNDMGFNEVYVIVVLIVFFTVAVTLVIDNKRPKMERLKRFKIWFVSIYCLFLLECS